MGGGGYILGACHVPGPCFDNFIRFIHVFSKSCIVLLGRALQTNTSDLIEIC